MLQDKKCILFKIWRKIVNKLHKLFASLGWIKDWVSCNILHPNRFVSIEYLAKRNSSDIEIIWKKRQKYFYTNEKNNKAEFAYKYFNEWCVKFNQASCFSLSDIILLKNGQCVYETKEYYKDKRHKITVADDVVLTEEHKSYYTLSIPQTIQRIPKAIFMSGLFAQNYYHLTMSILPKFQYLSLIDTDVPILVDKVVMENENMAYLINVLNANNRPIIKIEPDIRYLVDELYYISPQMISVPNYKLGAHKEADDDLYKADALAYLREVLLPLQDKDWNPPRYAFISRKKEITGRRKYNEEECLDKLKEIGFKVLYPEELTIEQQIKLSQCAKCIIGGSGAFFTNIVYSSQQSNYIIIRGKHNKSTVWKSLALYTGVMLNIFNADNSELENATREHDGFEVNVPKLKEYVYCIINRKS